MENRSFFLILSFLLVAAIALSVTSIILNREFNDKLNAIEVEADEKRYKIITGAVTLSENDTNTVFFIRGSSAYTIRLPAPKIGINYEFRTGVTELTNKVSIKTDGDVSIMYGNINYLQESSGSWQADQDSGAEGSSGTTGVKSIEFSTSKSSSYGGDYVMMVSDGDRWYFQGQMDSGSSMSVDDSPLA